uniref:Uncharacterized protein n=1 Tax=Rhizophora mucronata TaxID=61149 RepID=A0A2P2NUZ4_RHIMU
MRPTVPPKPNKNNYRT